MNLRDKLKRREFFAVSGGIAALAAGGRFAFESRNVEAAVISAKESPHRFTLDTGFRSPRSGPITTLTDGTLLWATTGPESPYLSRSMWRLSRIAVRRSDDGGKSWGEAAILQRGTNEYSVMSFGLFCLDSGTVLHVFARSGGYDYETGTPEKSLREIYFQHSTDNGKTFSAATKLSTGERYHGDILSLEQLRDGRIIYPFCFLTNVRSQFAVSVMYSDDGGKTWRRSESILRTGGGGFESGASEPTVVELPDGKLWMLIRAQTGFLWQSFSTDRGETWQTATESMLPSSNAPATMVRLRSGEIAVAWNAHVNSNYARQSLVIGLTSDGKTFRGVREIDFTDFTDDPTASIPHATYPFLTEMKNGDVAVSYNKGNWSRYNRPNVAAVSPKWIAEKNDVAGLHDGRTGWHTTDPGPKLSAAVERYVRADNKMWLEIEPHSKNSGTAGIIRNIPLVADGEINITVQVPKGEAYILFGNSLLSPRDADEAVLRIRFGVDGKIYAGAGKPENTQNNRRSTEYHYISHKISAEREYPRSFAPDETLSISVHYDAKAAKAKISVNDTASIEAGTGKILGIMYVGLLAANGGRIRFHSIRTALK